MASVDVKSALHVTAKHTCFFTTGWSEFLTKNNLKFGDTVLFIKVGAAEFQVT